MRVQRSTLGNWRTGRIVQEQAWILAESTGRRGRRDPRGGVRLADQGFEPSVSSVGKWLLQWAGSGLLSTL